MTPVVLRSVAQQEYGFSGGDMDLELFYFILFYIHYLKLI